MIRSSLRMWVGVFAAPAAWTVQHVVGLQLQFAQCHDNTRGPAYGVPVDTLSIAVTAVAAVIAVGGELAALAAWRSTRENDDSDPPPEGRIHFMSIIGITVSPLFLAIILMSGLGIVFLPDCVQS